MEEWLSAGLYLPLIRCRSAESCDGMDERPVTPQVMGCDGPDPGCDGLDGGRPI